MTRDSLLSLLEEKAGVYVSGEEISRKLQVSRTAVWKQVRRLEAEGYEIDAVPRLGYRLKGRPARLQLQELLPKLAGGRFGSVLKLFDEVGSTQDELRRLAEEGAPEGTLVIAERQTQGRGRMGRKWLSPSGKGIWMSLLLRPRIPLQLTPQLTLLAAVALCRAVTGVVPVEIGIKWPNDLLAEGKKISGILLESSAEDERLKYVVAGMGISANLEEADFPEELRGKSASLKMISGEEVDRAGLIAAVMQEFGRLYQLYQEEGFAPIRSLWEAYSVTLNRPAVLHTPQGTVEGVPVGLDDSGALRVRQEDGSVRTVYSAEVGDAAQG